MRRTAVGFTVARGKTLTCCAFLRPPRKFDRAPYNKGSFSHGHSAPLPTTTGYYQQTATMTNNASPTPSEQSSMPIEGGRVECFIHHYGGENYVGVRYFDDNNTVVHEDRFLRRIVSNCRSFTHVCETITPLLTGTSDK